MSYLQWTIYLYKWTWIPRRHTQGCTSEKCQCYRSTWVCKLLKLSIIDKCSNYGGLSIRWGSTFAATLFAHKYQGQACYHDNPYTLFAVNQAGFDLCKFTSSSLLIFSYSLHFNFTNSVSWAFLCNLGACKATWSSSPSRDL